MIEAERRWQCSESKIFLAYLFCNLTLVSQILFLLFNSYIISKGFTFLTREIWINYTMRSTLGLLSSAGRYPETSKLPKPSKKLFLWNVALNEYLRVNIVPPLMCIRGLILGRPLCPVAVWITEGSYSWRNYLFCLPNSFGRPLSSV